MNEQVQGSATLPPIGQATQAAVSEVGYVLRGSASSELVTADEKLEGIVLTPQKKKNEGSAVQKKCAREALDQLTPRQRQVLRMLAEGRRMREISVLLHVSQKTVEYHKYRLMKANGLENSTDLVRFALKNGLITD